MKRKKIRLWVSYLAGLFSGLMLALAAWVCTGRPMVFGGEVLVLPLIGVLIAFGWQLGQLAAQADMEQWYRRRTRRQ